MRIFQAIFISIACCSCGINYVDDRPEPIAWVDTHVSAKFIYKYTDSVSGASWNFPPDRFMNEFATLEANSNIVKVHAYYFPAPHEEIYRVKFTWPMVIEEVYSDSAHRILMKEDMTASEIKRIEDRFKREILQPMVRWGKERGIVDSVIYY